MILLLNMMTIDVASFLDLATLEISVIIRNEKGEDMAALSQILAIQNSNHT